MLRKLVWILPALVVLSVVLLLSTDPTWAQAPRPEYVPGELIIKFKINANPAAVSVVLSELGATRLRSFARIKASQERISQFTVEEAIARYGKSPLIDFIEPNYIYRAEETPNDPLFGQLWGLNNTGQGGGTPGADIRATQAWDRFTGSSAVLVAIIDTGVDYTHPDLAANIYANPGEIPGNGLDDDGNGFIDDVRGWDFVNNDNDPMDDHGHGTHVAGTIGAVGDNGIGVTGVNWHVSILPVKFLSAGGSGTAADAVSCVEYATMMQARVMNNSWGGGGYSEALRQAITEADAAEILFVAAAGNSGSNNDTQPFYPSSYDVPNIISVAATNHYDAMAEFSCYGVTSVDLGAPGEDILSCAPGSGYVTMSGTSMATPHVVGACALVLEAFPGMTAAEAKAKILINTDPLPSLAGLVLTGGRLNAFRAVALADSIPPDPVSDLLLLETSGDWVELRWTATGDDGPVGTASHYDIRYSPDPITEDNFSAAIQMSDEPDPNPSGSLEQARVTGLAFDTDYYLALKVRDESGNESPISNVVSGRTLLPPVIGVSPESLSDSLYTGGVSTQTLTISNTGSGELTFRVETGSYAQAAASRGGPDGAALLGTPSSTSLRSTSHPLEAFVPSVGHQPASVSAPLPAPGSATLQRMRERLTLIENDRIIFRDDMETGDNGWTRAVYEGESLWHQTMLSCNSPVHSWWCGRESQGTYATGSRVSTAVISPTINLVPVTAPIGLTFYESYNTEWGWDFCMVDASVDGGATWIPLRGGFGTAPSGSSNGWIETNLDLSGFAGEMVQLRFYFDTIDGGLNNYPGWFFDDVIVHGQGWLRTNPVAGVVPAGQTVDLTVTFDAAGLYGGDHTAVLSIFSNDPGRPQTNVPVLLQVTGAPDLLVRPAMLSFGAVFIGGSRTDTVEVRNVGTDILTVTALITDNPQEFQVDGSGFTLAPGSFRQVPVMYAPANTGPDAATLTIESNDPDRPSWQLPMSGEGIPPPDISVAPDSLFADLFTGGVETQVVTINNMGATDLLWSAVEQSTRLLRRTYLLPERSATRTDGPPNETRREGVPTHGGPVPSLTRQLSDLTGVRILWDTSHGQLPSYYWSILVADLVLRGAEVVENSQPLTPLLLSQFDFFWTTDSYESWSPGEMAALVQWVTAGGDLLIESDEDAVTYNQILSLMGAGITFVPQYAGSGLTTAIYPHQTTESITDLYYDNPLSILSPVEPPAVLLVRSTGLFPVTACAQVGVGRVLVASDEIFGDWDATLADNRQFGNQVCDWLAGASWLGLDPTSGVVSPGGAADLRVTFDASGLPGADYLSAIVISSNDPDESEVPVPALLRVTDAPELALSDRVLTFGPVYIGASRTDTLVVSNQGTTLLTVSTVAADNQVEFFVEGAGFSLAPGEFHPLLITYVPANAGPDSAVLTIESSDPDEPIVTVALLGEGVPPPDIAVEPDSVYVELVTGDTATRTLTVTNSGVTDLRFAIRTRGESGLARARLSRMAAGAGSDETYRAAGDPSAREPGEATLYDYGRVGNLPGVDRDPLNMGPSRSGTAKVLILNSGGDVQPILDLLRTFPDLTQVDVLDVYSATPSLDFLRQYDSAVLMISLSGFDAVALGDVLADYVDAGGGVVMTVASFISNWAVRGRFLNEGYGPFSVGTGPISGGVLGNYDAGHPIMNGVQTAQGYLLGAVELAPGATWVASFSDGMPFIATKGNQVAAVNIFVASPGYWAGDVPLILHNAIRWSQSVSWLTVEPWAGVVPPGGSIEISMLLDPGDLLGGDYHAVVEISSNDPDEPVIEVPAHMHVIGVPDIEVSAGVIDFGSIYIGASRTDTLFVSNPGTDSLLVHSIASGNPAEFLVDGAGFTLPPRETREVPVTYVPVDAGSDDFLLTIESNDPDEGTVHVSLQGMGLIPPVIGMSPDSLEADLYAGQVSEQTLTIRNAGAGGLDWSVTPSYAGFGRVLQSSPLVPSTGAPRAEKEPVELTLRKPPPEQLYVFPSPASPASAEPLRRALAPPGSAGSRDQVPNLETVLAALDAGYPAVVGAIPNRYDFSEGEFGSSISDGGNDMYDGGNLLGTDIGGAVEYSNGLITSNPAFGVPGRYFTRKYPGLFVMVADLQNVQDFYVYGNLGADGSGWADGAVLQTQMFGVTYQGFLKRVYGAGDPSVNHLIIVEYGPTLNQGFSTYTDDDYHFVSGLGAATRIYYLLYAGSGGSYIDNEAALNIMGEFLDAAGLVPLWLSASPESGHVAPSDTAEVAVTFDATELPPGYYEARLQVHSNDPLAPDVLVPVNLHVTRLDATFIRGDDDGSGEVNISDPIYSLVYQFAGGPSLCLDALDTNDDGEVDIADPIHNLAYQFADGPEPPAPFSACGTDPTPDSLDCWSHPFCEGVPLPAGRSPAGEEVTVTLTLGQVFSLGDGRVGYPVSLDTDVPLWGFEYAVRCVPRGPVFVGVTDSGCDYSHGLMDAAGGRVRVGNVFRLSLSEALSPGAHEVGYLAFDPAPGVPPPALELIEGIYVAEGGASGPIAGGSSPSATGEAVDIPDRLVCRVVPNPFGSSTVVHYSTPTAGKTSVEIYNAAGQRIRRLGHAEAIRGWHEATWDGTTEAGSPVAGGIYFVRVRAAGETKTERVILLK